MLAYKFSYAFDLSFIKKIWQPVPPTWPVRLMTLKIQGQVQIMDKDQSLAL